MTDPLEKSLSHSWELLKSTSLSVRSDFRTNKDLGPSSYRRPDKVVLNIRTEKSLIGSVYNRIAMDVAATPIKHVRVNKNGIYQDTIRSGLNDCLTVEANIDQSSFSFLMDAVLSLFEEGVIAIVPVETSVSLDNNNAFDILSMRTAKIKRWYPRDIEVEIYNDKIGEKQTLTLPKSKVAIVENPFYSVMNEPNSTLQRLMRKLALLDAVDEQSNSSKLDIIIQLPYTIKSQKRMEQAEKRRSDIEEQLSGSKYGIAYIDGTEKVVQLNRSAENNLMGQVEYLTETLYSQLGITKSVFDGTADEPTLKNYYSRSIDPILMAITLEMKRKFLTKTARTQGQSIEYFVDPFKIVPMSDLAEIGDKFIRNQILVPNEMRSVVGFVASDDPKAEELSNPNIANRDADSEESLIEEALAELDEEEAEYEEYQ